MAEVETSGAGVARATQVAAITKGDQTTQKFIHIYALFVTAMAFLFLFWAAFGHDYNDNPESREVIMTILGFLLGTALSAVIQYFFGSSSGSKSKSEQISLLSEGKK